MLYFTGLMAHRRDCRTKQEERTHRIQALTAYHGSLSSSERDILEAPISKLVADVHGAAIKPIDILRAYGKAALAAHAKTNCLTEVMITSAEIWVDDGSISFKGPLAGIPISLKDSIIVGGYDSCIGYSSKIGNAVPTDGGLVRLLKDAGAIPYVKTNVPITLLSFESANDVWGRTTNPHNAAYSPGGSTGGEGALLAAHGGRIGIGSDVAGSVRAPAHFTGIYALRCSTGRWPKAGVVTSMPGQEGVPSVFSPMARMLPDLVYFAKSILEMQPWRYDHSVHPLPWRPELLAAARTAPKLRVGVLRTDNVVDPSPACARALTIAVAALEADGHTCVDITPPSILPALVLASRLLNADGCTTFAAPLRPSETLDAGASAMRTLASLPRPLHWLYWAWTRYVRRDEVWAALVRDFRPHSAEENWALVAAREAYRAQWHSWWEAQKLDFIVAPPNATPAVPHGGMALAVASCGYTFLFNLLDYACACIPVTAVDRARDGLAHRSAAWIAAQRNRVSRGAYALYDAEAVHGLPVGVQIVGRRLQEEQVLGWAERVDAAVRGFEKGDGVT